MKIWKIVLSMVVIALSATMLTQPSQAAQRTPALRIGIAYDTGGPGDHSFNDAVASGISLAKKRFNIKVIATVTIGTETDRISRLKSLIATGANPIMAVGSGYAASVQVVAQMYPNNQFAIINDATISMLNVASLVFAEDQGGYLAGIAAAFATKKGRIGLLGSSPQSKKYELGFIAGAKSVKKNLSFDIAYVKDSAGSAAAAMITRGVDIIFFTMAGSDSEVINALVKANKSGAGVGLIVIEPDQYVTLASETKKYIVASVVKRVDKVVVDFISESSAGRTVIDVLDPKEGIYGRQYGIQNGGIEISLWSPELAKYRKPIYIAALRAGKLSK
ncbi:MAG: BMP family ABC transporter substrate-binding protein [Actinobacteria bacterium]|nr:BMP family ABC transporter substrate-binding protein [Actinomycetota bacterium]